MTADPQQENAKLHRPVRPNECPRLVEGGLRGGVVALCVAMPRELNQTGKDAAGLTERLVQGLGAGCRFHLQRTRHASGHVAGGNGSPVARSDGRARGTVFDVSSQRQQPVGALDRVVDESACVSRKRDGNLHVACFADRPGMGGPQVVELRQHQRSVLVGAQLAIEVRAIDPLHEFPHGQRMPLQDIGRLARGQLLQRKGARRFEQAVARRIACVRHDQ